MKDFFDWLTKRFQQPLCLLFFFLGAVLLILGIVPKLPKIGFTEIPDPYKWAAVGLGTAFVVLAVFIERGFLSAAVEEIPIEDMQSVGKDFATKCQGEMYWFNVPLGRCIPPLFNDFLRPAIENLGVTRIVFVLDVTVKPVWDRFVAPAVRETEASLGRGSKVFAQFHELKNLKPVAHTMAFKVINVDNPRGKRSEAHVGFYDDSWMRSFSIGQRDELMPKRMIRVRPGSELFQEIKTICDQYKVQETSADELSGLAAKTTIPTS